MTTIAWDTNILAADSRCMLGDTVLQYGIEKIFYPDPGKYWSVFGHKVLAYALSGNLDSVPWINETLEEDLTHHSYVSGTDNLVFHIIMVTESGHAYSWYMERIQSDGIDDSGLVPIHGPFAVGSGAQFALAVMAVGFSAHKAVEIASKLDTGTGGDVEVFSPPPTPETLSVRPTPQQYVVDRYTRQEIPQEIFDPHYQAALVVVNEDVKLGTAFDEALMPLVCAAVFKITQDNPNWHGFTTAQLHMVKERVKALPKDMDEQEMARQTVAWLEEFKPVSPKTLEQRMEQFERDRQLLLNAPVDEEEPMD